MTRRMYRYVIPVDDQPHAFGLTCGRYSVPVHVATAPPDRQTYAGHAVEFWAEADTDLDPEDRTFQVFGTGHLLPEDSHWVGTCDRTPDGLVWHLYELDGGS